MEHAAAIPFDRHLPLDGTFNVRDLGGYPTGDGRQTRWRTVWRADSLHRLPDLAQMALLAHGIRTVIDLRRPEEADEAPNVFRASPRVAYQHCSLLGEAALREMGPRTLEQVYRMILDERQEQVAGVVATLAAPGALPAVIHCTAGKDRTGLIAALLLGLAGVPAAAIAEDYALTERYLQGAFFEEARRRAAERGHDWSRYQHLLICPPDLMLATLDYLESRHGGIAGYLRAIGLPETTLETLREALVEPAAP
jgi:protein-tyrosine phosphatase